MTADSMDAVVLAPLRQAGSITEAPASCLAPPTQVLVLSEIPGLAAALEAATPVDAAEFTVARLDAIGDRSDGAHFLSRDALRRFPVIVADPPTFASSGIADACEGGRLRWVQSTYAGVDALLRLTNNRSYTCTRLAGVFGQAMAEYVIMHVLAVERRLLRDVRAQERREWGVKGNVASDGYRTVERLTMGVLGMGDIGTRVAEVASAMGMTVWACTSSGNTNRKDRPSSPSYVSRCFRASDADLKTFLGGCDYVVNLLPSTPQTRGLLSPARLAWCNGGAVLINVGRGDIFGEVGGEDVVVAALDAGHLRHAVLDVHAPVEPLPASSPLWGHPKVTVTPHNSARSFPEDVATAFANNLARFREGAQLTHALDWEKGY